MNIVLHDFNAINKKSQWRDYITFYDIFVDHFGIGHVFLLTNQNNVYIEHTGFNSHPSGHCPVGHTFKIYPRIKEVVNGKEVDLEKMVDKSCGENLYFWSKDYYFHEDYYSISLAVKGDHFTNFLIEQTDDTIHIVCLTNYHINGKVEDKRETGHLQIAEGL